MEFRSAGQRDERRRRVLMDECRAEAQGHRTFDVPPSRQATDAAHKPPKRYADVALTSHQPRIGDLIPCRVWTLTVCTAFLLACLAGMEMLYGYVALGYLQVGETRLTVESLAAIDLAGPANVGRWFSAWLLAMAAVLGYLTYLIRRHRLDDYRGLYRMWYWAVPLLILASLDQVADLQGSARALCGQLAGMSPQDPRILITWGTGLNGLLVVVGIRVAIEMRASRLAILALVTAAACQVAVTGVELGWMFEWNGVFQVMVTSALAMGGHVALLGAFCLYARHVHQDACGKLLVKRAVRPGQRRPNGRCVTPGRPAAGGRRKKKIRIDSEHHTDSDPGNTSVSGKEKSLQKAAEPRTRSSSGINRSAEVDADKPRPKRRRKVAEEPASQASQAAPKPHLQADSEPPATDETDSQPMSKAERRRLRKQKRKQRQVQ